MSEKTTYWWTGESAVSLSAAGATYYPKAVHPSTVFRHASRGNRYGIRLESFVSGGQRLTTVEAVARFVAATTGAANHWQQPRARTDSNRAEIAEARLDTLMSGPVVATDA